MLFMLKGKYSADGLAGTLAEGFRTRYEYFQQLATGHRGALVAAYWTEGDDRFDVVVLLEVEDPLSMKAIEVAINASGAVRVTATRLFTLDDMEATRALMPSYRPPGEPGPLV